MATSLQTAPRIFISHSHKDNGFGLTLVQDLRQALGDDNAVWYDAKGGLHGGDNIGTSDTYAPSDKSDLVDHQIAASVFVVIVNSGVQLTNLTTNQIKGIYAGKYTNWQQLGGPDLAIVPLSRGSGSGTRFTFDTYILGGFEQVPQPTPISNTATMITDVHTMPGAIGYADLPDVYTNLQSLIPVTIDGVPASPFTVVNNNYTFWTVEHMYTKGPATGLAQAFISYMNNEHGEQVMQNASFIVLHDMNASALSRRCSVIGDRWVKTRITVLSIDTFKRCYVSSLRVFSVARGD